MPLKQRETNTTGIPLFISRSRLGSVLGGKLPCPSASITIPSTGRFSIAANNVSSIPAYAFRTTTFLETLFTEYVS